MDANTEMKEELEGKESQQDDAIVSQSDKPKENIVSHIEKWIDAEDEATFYLVKSHPRGKEAIQHFASKVKQMISDLLDGEKIPELHTATKEEIEASISGFWVSRVEKFSRKRQSA